MTWQDFFSFGWWNTGLCPPRKKPAHTVEQWECARQVIQQLAKEVDLLALGEVTVEEAERLHAECGLDVARLVLDVDIDRGHRRNLAVIFNEERLQLIEGPRSFYDIQGGHRLHVGMHLLFALGPVPALLHVFVVHWPSRMMPDSDELRRMLGRTLQSRIEELSSAGGRAAHVVVLGDFNDEPFDPSLSRALLGARDRDLVRRRPRHLYNPFWRLLGERQALEDEVGGRLGAGTHYFNRTMATHWHTYDQFLVSASLLVRPGWVLMEGSTRIWQNPPLLNSRGGFASGFDHFPVLGTLAHVALAETSPGA